MVPQKSAEKQWKITEEASLWYSAKGMAIEKQFSQDWNLRGINACLGVSV